MFNTNWNQYMDEALGAHGLEREVKPKRVTRDWFANIPEVKPLPLSVGLATFAGLSIIGISIGATIGTYIFFGTATLAGLIAIAESNKYVKHVVINSTKWIDAIIFISSVVATATLGVTVAASLTFAGLGYTLVYAPYVREMNQYN